MSFAKFRERLNLKLFESKKRTLSIFRILNILVSLTAIGSIIYYYGYPQTKESEIVFFSIIQVSFAFYVLKFAVKLLYDFHPLKYIKKHWLESATVLFLIAEGINYLFFDDLIIANLFSRFGFDSFQGVSTFFVQFYFLFLLFLEVRRNSSLLPKFKLHPALLFVGSIASLTLIGAWLLTMPEMSNIEGGMCFVDALFMGMSSTSVTGLATVDLAQMVTFKGQVVVMILIKLGGLNTIAFGALLLLVAKFGVGIKHHEVIEDFVNKDSISNTKSMFSKIIIWSTSIELVGIVMLYITFGNKGLFANNGDRLFQSIFHGLSGFNNAGLSILPGGMMNPLVADNYIVHLIILILFFLGGFGMIYLFDLFGIRQLRERMSKPWKTINFGTKISLYTTLILLFLGAIVFFIFEKDNTMKDGDVITNVITSFYQSMTSRNAGFNIVDTAALSMPVLISFLFLMFIGASSGSAGGGIRTSTFAIMWASVVSTIKGKKNTELFKRTISNDLVLKSYAIMLFFVVGNVVGPFVLAISEADLLASGRFTFMDLVFEHVSAASTVGLSTGITSELSSFGKYVLILAMFIGRVGTLTMAYLFGKEVISTKYKYPSGHTMVG